MPFDAAWFDELRGLSEDQIQKTHDLGIVGFVPNVDELYRDGHISSRFLEETRLFVRSMARTRYRFDTYFRAWARHLANFPKGRAFRKQWNIAFTAGDSPDQDYVRIGIGFSLSTFKEATGIEEYLEFREQVRLRQAAFDQAFQILGNYHELDSLTSESASGALSPIIIADQPPSDGWRLFGKRLWF